MFMQNSITAVLQSTVLNPVPNKKSIGLDLFTLPMASNLKQQQNTHVIITKINSNSLIFQKNIWSALLQIMPVKNITDSLFYKY